MKQRYVWAVALGAQRVEVIAADKLEATRLAAKKLGVLWSRTARDMVVMRLRKATHAEGRIYESFF